MEGVNSVNGQAATPKEHRRHPRFLADGESSLLFLDLGLTKKCKIMDLSLEGCRVKTSERLPGNAGPRVEVAFKIKGMSFRFKGVLRWTDGQQQAGIQFVDMLPRCRADLAELDAEIAASVPKTTAEEPVPKSCPQPSPSALALAAAPLPAKPAVAASVPAQVHAAPQAAAAAQGARRERRAQNRHQVDASATILLVRGGMPLSGRVVDLSLSGCRIRTREMLLVGVYTRVEVEFRLRSLPFRLAGVIQAIHNRATVGVRFLELSDRKRQQVVELIEEIEQARLAANGIGALGANPQAEGPSA